MLITKQTTREAIDRLDSERTGLNEQVGTMLRELDQIRADARRLMDDRRKLEVYVEALRTELQGLQAKRQEMLESMAAGVVNPNAAPTISAPMHRSVEQVTPAAVTLSAQSDHVVQLPPEKPLRSRRAPSAEQTAEEDQAFQKFFENGEYHDKSREWILS